MDAWAGHAFRRRLASSDLLLGTILFGGALLVRWPLVSAAPYGDEAVHFVMARSLGFLDDSIVWSGSGDPVRLVPFVLGRPLFALAHFPSAQAGFEGFRLAGVLFASLLPPVAFGLLRVLGSARWLAASAASVVALHPTFVVWGARIFPDTLMAVLALLAVAGWALQRPALGSAFVVLACWTKESAWAAGFGLAAFVAWTAVAGTRQGGRPPLRALLANGAVRWAVVALVVGALPLVVGYLAFPRLPGWTMGGEFAPAWERLWLASWFALAPFAALAVPRARPLAAAGLGLMAFYLAFHGLRGGAIQSWYAVLPGVVGLLCMAVVLDAAFKSVAWPRLAVAPVGCLVAAVLLVAIVGSTGAVAAFHPLAPAREPGLVESIAFVQAEGPEVAAAWEFQRAARPASVLGLDLMWFWVGFPVAGSESTRVAYPALTPDDEVLVEQLASQAEESDLVWMQDWGGTFERAFRATYADCEVFAAGNWVAFRAKECPGRGASLRTEFDRLSSA
jgi:hypothetical protein